MIVRGWRKKPTFCAARFLCEKSRENAVPENRVKHLNICQRDFAAHAPQSLINSAPWLARTCCGFVNAQNRIMFPHFHGIFSFHPSHLNFYLNKVVNGRCVAPNGRILTPLWRESKIMLTDMYTVIIMQIGGSS